MLGFSVAKPTTRRGAGLGNEVFPLAKAYIASRRLGLKLVEPPWVLNPRRYDREMGLRPADLGNYAWTRMSPRRFQVTEQLFRSTGLADYGAAMVELQKSGTIPRRGFILDHSGMWGGYRAINESRQYLGWRLQPDVWAPSWLNFRDQFEGRLHVAIHLRAGDFQESTHGPLPGDFNKVLPAQWYMAVLNALEGQPDLDIRYSIHTDSPGSDITKGILTRLGNRAYVTRMQAKSDVMAMASADLLICSVSSLSMLAGFLSNAPYIWFKPQLTPLANCLTLWGGQSDLVTRESVSLVGSGALTGARGFAFAVDTPLPTSLVEIAMAHAVCRWKSTDLLQHGAISAGKRD
jgi:hypothetical protein